MCFFQYYEIINTPFINVRINKFNLSMKFPNFFSHLVTFVFTPLHYILSTYFEFIHNIIIFILIPLIDNKLIKIQLSQPHILKLEFIASSM